MQEEDHIKRLFNEKLKGFEADVPDSLWSRIDASLPKGSDTVFVKKQRSRSRIIKWTATAVSVAAMIALLFILTDIDRSQEVSLQQLVESLPPQEGEDQNLQHEVTKPVVEELYTQDMPASTRKERMPKSVNVSEKLIETTVENHVSAEIGGKEVVAIVDVDENPQKETKESRSEIIAKYEQEILDKGKLSGESGSKTKPNSGLSLSVNSRSNFALLNTVETANADGASYLPQLYTKKEEVEFRHYQPIALGVSLSKEIFRDLRAEVGVSYIYATSRVKAKPNDNFELDDRQVFHYLAVPVSVSYRFAEINKFKFQFAVGGTVQKDFYGLVKGKAGLKDLMPNDKMTKKRELEQENPQFSINANLGASYPIYKKLHVYGKIGWAYYLDAENQYKTIYSDRPHQLDLNLGLRYDF